MRIYVDLFSGSQSVLKALLKSGLVRGIDFQYYGFDIYSPEGLNIILDLSQDDIVNKVVAALPKGLKPDFIWASPVCNKFSLASAVKGGNVYFEKTKYGVKIRENMKPLKGHATYGNYTLEYIQTEAKFHLNLISNMQKIIDYYDCDFVIENPRQSYIKNFLNPLYIMNRVDYCQYGFDYKKPTTIYSNYNLELKVCNHKHHSTKIGSRTTKKEYGESQAKVSNYAEKASVPPQLIIDILNMFNKEE